MIKSSSRTVCKFHKTSSRLVLKFKGSFPSTGRVLLKVGCHSATGVMRGSLGLVRGGIRECDGGLRTGHRNNSYLRVRRIGSPIRRTRCILRRVRGYGRGNVGRRRVTVLFQIRASTETIMRTVIRQGVPFRVGRRLPGVCRRFVTGSVVTCFQLTAKGQHERSFLRIVGQPGQCLKESDISKDRISFRSVEGFCYSGS